MRVQQRRERERENRIKAIKEAALELFAQKGYSETNLDDIAWKAELGKATLYYYFKGKEEIFWAILEEGAREFYQSLFERIKRYDKAAAILRELIEFFLEYFETRTSLLKLIFPWGRHSPMATQRNPAFERKVATFRKPVENHLAKALEAGASTIKAETLSEIIWSYLVGVSVKLIQGRSSDEVRGEMSNFLSLVEDNLGNA